MLRELSVAYCRPELARRRNRTDERDHPREDDPCGGEEREESLARALRCPLMCPRLCGIVRTSSPIVQGREEERANDVAEGGRDATIDPRCERSGAGIFMTYP